MLITMRILLSTLLASTLFAGLAGLAANPAPSPSKPAKVDVCGDPLPVGASARLGTVRLRHGGQISCMALSPDNKSLVSGELGRFVHLWDTVTG